MKKRLAAMLLAVVLVMAPLSTAFAADSPDLSSNIHGQLYEYGRWATTVKSYLYENESGGLTRVEYVPAVLEWGYHNGSWNYAQVSEEGIAVEEYSSDFILQRKISVSLELDIWGGFFAGESYNFLVFGQENKEENNEKEVIRVVKYSKDWRRLGQASLYGANTTVPFDAGSLRAAEYGDMLYLRTSHEMYTSTDGLNHQANLTMAVRESDMTMTDSAYAVAFYGSNYVSHSFNQFILVDQEKRIVSLDHGDAYPRSAELAVFAAEAGSENITKGGSKDVTIQSFPGETGANDTGASLGGLAETADGYVVAYNYDGAGSSRTSADRKVYLAYVDKETLSVQTKTVSGTGVLPPVLAPTGLNGGYLLWNACDANGNGTDKLYYTAYSEGGNVGTVKTATAPLSDCQPILYNGKLVWYVTDDSRPVFYTLDGSGVNKFYADARDRFTDLSSDGFYLTPVMWAVNKGITSGTSDTKFSPDQNTSRAQIVSFLWRAAGRPEPETAVNPFTDVKESDYYYKPVLWAYENKIVAGTSETTFSPNQNCTRGQIVTFLWRAEDHPEPETSVNPFKDVKETEYYYKAVLWAYENKIVAGTSATAFSPNQACTRGQAVTFLYRDLA